MLLYCSSILLLHFRFDIITHYFYYSLSLYSLFLLCLLCLLLLVLSIHYSKIITPRCHYNSSLLLLCYHSIFFFAFYSHVIPNYYSLKLAKCCLLNIGAQYCYSCVDCLLFFYSSLLLLKHETQYYYPILALTISTWYYCLLFFYSSLLLLKTWDSISIPNISPHYYYSNITRN